MVEYPLDIGIGETNDASPASTWQPVIGNRVSAHPAPESGSGYLQFFGGNGERKTHNPVGK
jgi:hypothetical protein